jgi:microsomal epoxide hydrolase
VLGLPGGIPHELVPPETVRRYFNLTDYRIAPRGGHYPGLEIPDILVERLRQFYRPLRGRGTS